MENVKVNILSNNHAIIYGKDFTSLQSYSSIIARIQLTEAIKENVVELDKNKWDYSKSTGKHRNEFLNETKKETQKKIDDGTYKLVDLN